MLRLIYISQPGEATARDIGFWGALPSLLWIVIAFIALLLFRKQLGGLFENLSWRLRTGTAIKLFSLELGQTYVAQSIDSISAESTLEHRGDENSVRWKQREQYYVPNRKILLVHRLAPSTHRGMLYDVEIYLVPHRGATLATVAKAEYYFGRNWGNQLFSSNDRARSFLISTSAYGPFMCTVELFFTDGERVIISRYIDFEMGSIGSRL